MSTSPIPFLDARAPGVCLWDHPRGCNCASCSGPWDDGLLGVIALTNKDGVGFYKTYGRSLTREMAIDKLLDWYQGKATPLKDWLTEQREWLERNYPYARAF